MSLRHLSTLLLLTAAMLLIGCPGSTPPEEDTPPEAPENAVLMPIPEDPTISFSVWFKVGSANDPVGKEGLAALTGQMIAEGATSENSYEDILQQLFPIASSYDVWVDKEMTTVRGRTHRDNLETFFRLYTDAYLRPAFNEEDFNRLKSDQLNFLQKTLRYASDEEFGKAALYELVFADTSYRHPVPGTVEGLKSITLDDVRSFYNQYYSANNAVIALGGGYPEDLVNSFHGTLAQLPQTTVEPLPAPTPKPLEGRKVLLVQKPDADASISMGFPIDVKRGERDFYALWIATSWLGEHRNSSSHLYQVIREDRGMNYGDYTYIEAFPRGGSRQFPPPNSGRQKQIFEIWIRTLPNDNALFATRAALREFQNLVDNGMTEEDFERTRSFVAKYSLQFAKTTSDRLAYAVDDLFYGIDDPGHLQNMRDVIPTITRDEVNAALKKHFNYNNLGIAIITGQAEALKQAMIENRPSPPVYATPKSDEILEDDKSIVEFPLNVQEGSVEIIDVETLFEK